LVERHRANRAVLLLKDFLLIHAYWKNVVIIRVADLFKSQATRKSQRAFSRKHHMRCFLHDASCNADRINHPNNGRYGPGLSRGPIHDRCIELDIARRIRCGTAASNIQTTGFHFRNHILNGVDRSRSGLKPGLAFFDQPTQVLFNDRIIATGNGAGTAV